MLTIYEKDVKEKKRYKLRKRREPNKMSIDKRKSIKQTDLHNKTENDYRKRRNSKYGNFHSKN